MKFYTAAAFVAALAGTVSAVPTDLPDSIAVDPELMSGAPFTLEAKGGSYDGQRISLLDQAAGQSWAFINGVSDGFAIEPFSATLFSTREPEVDGNKFAAKFDDATGAVVFDTHGAQVGFAVAWDGYQLLRNGSSVFYACSNLEGNANGYPDQALAFEPRGDCEQIEVIARLAPAN